MRICLDEENHARRQKLATLNDTGNKTGRSL